MAAKRPSFKIWIIPILLVMVTVFVNQILGTVLVVGYLVFMMIRMRSHIFSRTGIKHYENGELEKAKLWFSRAVKNPRADATILLSFALILMKLGDFDEAGVMTRRAEDKELNEYNTNVVKSINALILWKNGSPQIALQQMQLLIRDFQNATLYGCMGALCLSEGLIDKAHEINLEAHEFDELNKTICDNLGRSYLLKGDVEKAEEIFDDLVDRYVKIPEPYINKAIILKERGETEEAEAMLEKAKTRPFSHISYFSKEEFTKLLSTIQ